MQRSFFIRSICSAVLVSAAAFRWGWQQSFVVEIDPRLDPSWFADILSIPHPTQELSLLPALPVDWESALPSARLKLTLERPPRTYSAGIYRELYVQVVAPFQSVLPPLRFRRDDDVGFPTGHTIYTAQPLVFARYHQDCAALQLLENDQAVIEAVHRDPAALGILDTDHVVPQLRTLTPPYAIRLWLGWRPSSWRLLSAIGVNLKLWRTVATLMHQAQRQARPRLLSLVAVGDIMLAREIGAGIRDRDSEPLYPFTYTAGILKNADVATGNLECAVADIGTAQPGKDYTFRAQPRSVDRLRRAAFTILNVANNHSMDFGGAALLQTIDLLHEAGIQTVGGGRNRMQAGQLRFANLKDGTRLGFLSYSMVLPENFIAERDHAGVSWVDESRFRREIAGAKALCDLLVVQFHWGEQYTAHSNARQRETAHWAIDSGADLVIGHHPHWIQELEFYKGGFIAYSLGNFVFDMDQRPKVREGLLLRCWFKDRKLYQAEPIPVIIQHGEPAPMEWGSAEARSRETILREMFQQGEFLNQEDSGRSSVSRSDGSAPKAG